MILKGSQRAGGRQMALHLLNGDQNEHVNVHEVRGFMADDVLGALNEAYALSKGTQCRQFMYSLSLSPPETEKVSIQVFEKTIECVEKNLGLEGQPRVVVFHEKNGRRHAHCVWSRIDADEMKAINIAFPKRKLNAIAKSLYLEHGWKMPEGFKDRSKKNPLNYTRAEWQQALRIGRKPSDIKRELQECWATSDDKKSFEQSLQEKGYYLANGRRGFMAVDTNGEIFSLTRQLGQKKQALQERLGKAGKLISVDAIKAKIKDVLLPLYKSYIDDLKHQHKQDAKPIYAQNHAMITHHRQERTTLEDNLKTRWQDEEQKRAVRIRKGFKGVWDKLNGRYWKTRKRNERETWQAHKRDDKQRETLTHKQLTERQTLQIQLKQLHEKQEQERKGLFRDLSHLNALDQTKDNKLFSKEWLKELEHDQHQETSQDTKDDLDIDDPENEKEPDL